MFPQVEVWLINVISTLFRRPETNIVFSMFFQRQLKVISGVGSAQRNFARFG